MPVAPIERNDHAEPNAEAFIFGFDFPADGVIQKIDWTKIKPTAACPPAGWRWLHFNRLAEETRQWLEEFSDLDETVITALLQAETRPRCAAYEDGLLLNLRGINHNPGAEPEDMISVRIWATQNLVISMRSYPVKAVHEVREEVAAGLLEYPSPGGLLVMIAERLIDKIEPVVDQLKDEADEHEETLLSSREQLPATALAEFRRTILILRRYILPQREAMAQQLGTAGLQCVTVSAQSNHADAREAIHLATMHRAKGLEFDAVVVVAPDGYFGDPEATANQRKLVYVSLTRAKRAAILIRMG